MKKKKARKEFAMWMTDLLKQNTFMCLHAKEELREKKAFVSIFRVYVWLRDDEEENAICCMLQREMFFMLPLFGVSKHLKMLSSNRVMNCQGCNEIIWLKLLRKIRRSFNWFEREKSRQPTTSRQKYPTMKI